MLFEKIVESDENMRIEPIVINLGIPVHTRIGQVKLNPSLARLNVDKVGDSRNRQTPL